MSKADDDFLDGRMFAYLEMRSCTTLAAIEAHFELHPNNMLADSLKRLTKAGLVSYDERRDGYQTHRPPAKS